ncbi:hypothetical protein S7335_66 [Synechococcus sp. PCC 7335]|nr:hypothetical protein S7335_66 [Synechococcus sp. PCC 7335]
MEVLELSDKDFQLERISRKYTRERTFKFESDVREADCTS